ncbi:MAG: hypothetical protein ACYC99_13305 [Candidatus Geothermincolia bacterium]
MTVSLRRNAEDQPQAPLQKDPKRDIYDIIVRMLIGLVMNYITRRLRGKQDLARARKDAARKMQKLAKKGKEIPKDLEKEAVAGLSRGKQKKLAKAAEKKEARVSKKGKDKKKKKGHKLLWMVAVVVAIALAVKVKGKK